MRLSEQVFVRNNTLGPGIGYTPHQLVLGIGSGVPGIYQVPESDSAKLALSLKRIKTGINKSQAEQPPSTLGDGFPYEPGDLVHFLGPHGQIGQGYITGIFGKEYRVAHSCTRVSTVSNEYISPTIKMCKSYALKSALCPVLNTIKCRSDLKVRFKLGTKRANSRLR